MKGWPLTASTSSITSSTAAVPSGTADQAN